MRTYGWFMVAAYTVVLLPADFVLACFLPDRIAPLAFVALAFGFPAFGVYMMLSR